MACAPNPLQAHTDIPMKMSEGWGAHWVPTHIFVGGEIGRHQVGMEAREAKNGPDGEEADHKL